MPDAQDAGAWSPFPWKITTKSTASPLAAVKGKSVNLRSVTLQIFRGTWPIPTTNLVPAFS
jgi:hypothetical protein